MVGKTLGHYQVTNQLGKGGMGKVYRAKDQKLGRDVAIKVLPEEFAKDADRVARFQREARLLASLNHPNIASIYGLEESDGTNFLVLELVEGETLADRLKHGPVPVIEGVLRSGFAPQYAVSDSGALVYIPSTTVATAQRTLLWVDQKGKVQPLAAHPNDYRNPHISPDGTKLALQINADYSKSDIWIWDLARETMTRLTFNEASTVPLWTLDGKRVAFLTGSNMSDYAVCFKAANGTAGDEKLVSVRGRAVGPCSWSKDGKILVTMGTTGRVGEIGSLSMEGDHKWRPLLQEKYNETQPKISPDGQWMAYASDESGKYEIYVRSFPDVNKGRWQISTSGGLYPLWSPDGRELFYRSGDSVMVVAKETDPTFKPGKAESLFQGKYASSWDISPDGKRFLMMKESESAATLRPQGINIVLNWFEELKERVPVK